MHGQARACPQEDHSHLLRARRRGGRAGCFKIPIIVEVTHRVDAGALRPDVRLTLTEADKSHGITLIHGREGLRLSVRDMLYLMITLSDNTATDMLWRLVGLRAVNETMRKPDLAAIDSSMANREHHLMERGAGNGAAIVYTPSGAPIVVVVHCRGLSYSAKERASQAIAGIGAELHEHLGKPA